LTSEDRDTFDTEDVFGLIVIAQLSKIISLLIFCDLKNNILGVMSQGA